MARCKRCNGFILFSSGTGFCKKCNAEIIIEQQKKQRQEREALRKAAEEARHRAEEPRRREAELLKTVEDTARRKKEEARIREEERRQSLSEEQRRFEDAFRKSMDESMDRMIREMQRQTETEQQAKPQPRPVEFKPGSCSFPYGNDPECSKGDISIYLSAEDQKRIYDNVTGNILEYVDPLKDIYEKVFNELVENVIDGHKMMERMESFRQQYRKNMNESDETIAARSLLSHNLTIGVPYKLRK